MKKQLIALPLIMVSVILLSGCGIGGDAGQDQNVAAAEESLKGKSSEDLMAIARETDDPIWLTYLARHSDPGVRSDAAKNPNLPKEEQDELVDDPSWLVRNYLGANPALAAYVASQLADDPDQRVRWVVAKNPTTPEDILVKLAADTNIEVQRKLVTNTNLSEPVLIEIARVGDPEIVVKLIDREDLTDAVWEQINQRTEAKIREAVAAKQPS